MQASVEISQLEILSLSADATHVMEYDSAALYLVYAGVWTLDCSLNSSPNPASRSDSIPRVPTSSLNLSVGDLVIVTQGMPHQLSGMRNPAVASDESSRCLRIAFEPRGDLFSQLPLLLNSRSLPLNLDSLFFPSHSLSWQTGDFSTADRALLELMAKSLIGIVITSHVKDAPHDDRPSLDPEIAETLLVMKREPGRHWTIESLATEAGISRSALALKFKEQVGQTLSEHLLNVRMQLADRLLKDRRHHLKEIARMTGYQSVSAFSTAFKRWSGHPPSVHRKLR